MNQLSLLLTSSLLVLAVHASAETCVTQSAMPDPTYNAITAASLDLATKVQIGDASAQAAIKANTISMFATNFAGIADTITSTAPHLKGTQAKVDQVYLLDASMNKLNPDGTAPDASFYCSLNHSQAEADFSIPGLPPGRYAFAMVRFDGPQPWLLSILLQQQGAATAPWLLAGLYPKATTADGHDGLWYWTQARAMVAAKQPWNAYIYYEEAKALLTPAGFVSSSHLDDLRTEALNAAPPAIANGIGSDSPLVVKDASGAEFDFLSLGPDSSLNKPKLEVAAYLKIDNTGTTVGAPANNDQIRKRNVAAMSALLHAYPEFRQAFYGVWIFAQAPGLSPIPTEAPMDDIH